MRKSLALAVVLTFGACVGTSQLVVTPEPDGGQAESDAGAPAADAGSDLDAGPGTDAGAPVDAGVPDAGVPDAGPPDHSSCAQAPDTRGTSNRVALNPYVAYVPASYDPRRPTPLVVALHGAGDTPNNYLSFMWRANADARGFIVIAPQGSPPYLSGFAWQGSDDATVLAALDDVVKCYSIDPHHVILNGFSAGGTMAYFIGLSRALRFSGLAIQSSSLSAGENVAGRYLLPAPWKVPVSHFHGDQDQNFVLADAQSGITRLQNAGHPVNFHVFSGGHQATAADALVEYDELKSSSSP